HWCVLDVDRQSTSFGEIVANVHVAPAELRRHEHASGDALDHAGDYQPDAFAAAGCAVRGKESPDAFDKFGGEEFWVEDRFQRFERDLRSGKIAQHDEGAAEAHIDGDDEAVLRADVEHGRAASARGVAR